MKAVVKIIIDFDTIIDFYKEDIGYGQGSKPYQADNFCSILGDEGFVPYPYAHNAFKLQPDTNFTFEFLIAKAANGSKVVLQEATFSLSMIRTSIPTKEDWAQIFDLNNKKYNVTIDGRLVFPAVSKQENEVCIFKIQTLPIIDLKVNLQYHIDFQIRVDGQTKLVEIDPLIANYSE